MTTPTLFTAFMDLLVELGINPQPDERDPFGTIRTAQVMTKLEAARDFPLEKLPVIKEYALKVHALNPDALIKEMRRMVAQELAPAKARAEVIYSDDAIVAVLASQTAQRCNCDNFPECQPAWRRAVMA